MWKIYIILIVGYVNAITDEQVKANFIKVIMKCTKEHPVEMTELVQLQNYITPTDMKTKCLLACAYRVVGTLNDKGEYDLENGYKMAEESKNGDEKRLINGRKLAETCVKVNDIAVSDGTKGCDRSAHIFKCIIKNAPKLGFKV